MIDPALVADVKVGLRPFRPQGFVVRSENFGQKTVIHNYGHGGCGVTLSWGTADMAANLALQTPHRQAAVLGCGIIGLTTARLLQDRGFEVKIYAKDLPPHTTSNVAAAQFGVTNLLDEAYREGPIVPQIQQAARFAYDYFQQFLGDHYGVYWNDFYLIGDQPQQQPWDFAITPELYPLTSYQPGTTSFGASYASSFPALRIETQTYLSRLVDDFYQHGGEIITQNFGSLEDVLAVPSSLIMNCTGLGSRVLFSDQQLIPVRGQIVLLHPQQDINYVYLDGRKDLYMFPRSDALILGGTHGRGDYSLEVNQQEVAAILAGHAGIVAGMN